MDNSDSKNLPEIEKVVDEVLQKESVKNLKSNQRKAEEKVNPKDKFQKF